MSNDFWTPELREWLQPGNKVYVNYGKGNVNTYLLHIRAIVDGDWIVSRWWGRTRQRWMYDIDEIYRFFLLQEEGHLEFRGKENE